ncbi:MAG: F0F1 ATP synthase subunit gamma [Candidatus Omnitrophica bacterium]|nr:F0F1 ATP synthase subunit gamma [Candidatus Omnitrophota bacterium]
MKTVSSLKKDLEFNVGLSALLEALKTIAVTQYRILEHKIVAFEKLVLNIESFFEILEVGRIEHLFLKPNDLPLLVVAVTSDSGLLGGLNMQVITSAFLELENKPGKLIVIGERGKVYAREGKFPFVAFGGIRDEERYGQAMQLRDYCAQKMLEGSFGALKVVYPCPVSFTVQRVEIAQFIPFLAASKKEFTDGAGAPEVILESKVEDIIEYLIYTWMGQRFYEIFGLSRLAEFAARFVHLEESSQKLKEIDKKARLEYFRVRHELIDRNMRELFAARLLYANQ